jgi:hypothetical protein
MKRIKIDRLFITSGDRMRNACHGQVNQGNDGQDGDREVDDQPYGIASSA